MKEVFDFQKFVFRTHLKQREVASMTGASAGLVGNWASGKAVPSYQNLARLIEIGMKSEELFGEELSKKLKENDCCQSVEPPTRSDLKAVVREIMDEIKSESGSPNL